MNKTLNKFVVLKPANKKEESKEKTSGFGFTESEIGKMTFQEAEVACSNDNCLTQKGDRVLYNQHNSHTQVIDGEQFEIVDERDIALIL
jgi:co-chaperonin GroES (HSP10)